MDTAQLSTLIRAVARLRTSHEAIDETLVADLARLISGGTVAAADAPAVSRQAPARHDLLDASADTSDLTTKDVTSKRSDYRGDDTGGAGRHAARGSDERLQAWPALLRPVTARADLDTSHPTPATSAPAAPSPLADATPHAAPLESLFAARRVRGILREMAARQTESGRIDIQAVVRTLARAQWPARLPRQRVTRVGQAIHLMFDAGPDMLPFAADKQQLASVALRILGRDRLRVFDFIGTPRSGVRAQRQVRWSELAWPGRGSTIVVVSDFGIGGDDVHAYEADWFSLRDEALRRGVRCVALLPYGRDRWPEVAGRFDAALSWDLDVGVQRLRRSRRLGSRSPLPRP
jgi:hypothetical protein